MKKYYLLILSLLIFHFSFSQTSILFIGNSLTNGNSTNIDDPTTGNSIPHDFRSLAIAAGYDVHVEMYAPNGVYIYDDPNNSSNTGHCNRTITENLINSRQWDYVFVQDNVGSYMWGEDYLSANVGNSNVQLLNKIKANNPCTREIFYAAQGFYSGLPSDYWHSGDLDLSYDDNIQATIRSYGNSNYLNGALDEIVAPAGLAWNRYCNDGHSKDDLYYDTAHPTAKGSYLSAAVVFSVIFKIDPTNINWDNGFSDAEYLRQIAYETVFENSHFSETNLDTYTPDINQTENILSVAGNYSSYQWIEEPNQITGATSSTYEIENSGIYSVYVTNSNGCKLKSKALNFDYTTVSNTTLIENSKPLCFFENRKLRIENAENFNLYIYDILGQKISSSYITSNLKMLNFDFLTRGIYIIKLSNTLNPQTKDC